MGEPSDLVIVEPDGSVRVPGPEAARQLQDHSGRYRIVLGVPGLMVLREGDDHDPRQSRVLMAGEIVSRMTVMEVINVIANANWRGELHVLGPDAHRVLAFDQGALKTARSDAPSDRLGEVLYRLGVLRRDQLDHLLEQATSEQRFGQMLVDHGILEEETLFQYLQSQAEQIFYNTLVIDDGHYLFRLPTDTDATAPSATLHIPVQHLLMEGVQRIDEMALFRERIPSSDMCPQPKEDAPSRELDEIAQRALELCDGARSIGEIARTSGLGEFETTKAVYHLLQQGQLVLRSSTRVDPDTVRRLVSRFNDVMRDIFMAVATYGGIDQTRDKLRHWIASNGYAPLLGEEVEEDGSIDYEAVTERLACSDHEHPLEGLHQALHELVAFTLFAASHQLPRDQERSLSRDVNRRLKAIRL